MSTAKILPPDKKTVTPTFSETAEPVRMGVIEQVAAMTEVTERPALIWGNTDRATVAAEAL